MMMIALAFLLVHMFVPHHHHANISSKENVQEHQSASSLIDFIALSYHNQNEQDLTDYTFSHHLDIEFGADLIQKISTIVALFIIVPQEETKDQLFANPNLIHREVWQNVYALRGPPTIIA